MSLDQIATYCDALGAMAVTQGHDEYDARRTVWNASVDRRPPVIVACQSTADVQRAVTEAARRGLPLSVRGGGHNIAGTAVRDGTVMIDLSDMNAVRVDADTGIVRVAGGATFGQIDAATQGHGLAVPGGVVSSTGVGGLTLGGGIGWLARRHGLTIDNLIAAAVVTADGQVMEASDRLNPNLFWALRGGGGNFGIATEFTFQAHPIGSEVSFGPTFFDLESAEAVLNAYATHSDTLTREACVWANLMTAPPSPALPEEWHGQKVLTMMQFHAGPLDQARADLTPLYGGAAPLGSALASRPYVEAQSFLDEAYAFGARNYWRSHNHDTLTPALIAELLDLAPDLPTPGSELLICQLGGAVQDVAPDATAFPHRAVPFLSTPGVRWHDPLDDTRVVGWLKEASDRIAAHAVPGAYVNFIAEEDGAAAAYQTHMDRLMEIKRRYDPRNLFCVNQNISPAPPPDPGGAA